MNSEQLMGKHIEENIKGGFKAIPECIIEFQYTAIMEPIYKFFQYFYFQVVLDNVSSNCMPSDGTSHAPRVVMQDAH